MTICFFPFAILFLSYSWSLVLSCFYFIFDLFVFSHPFISLLISLLSLTLHLSCCLAFISLLISLFSVFFFCDISSFAIRLSFLFHLQRDSFIFIQSFWDFIGRSRNAHDKRMITLSDDSFRWDNLIKAPSFCLSGFCNLSFWPFEYSLVPRSLKVHLVFETPSFDFKTLCIGPWYHNPDFL